MTILSRAYQWKINATNTTVGASDIAGATTPFYTTQAGDVGKYIFLVETPVNEAGSTPTPSNIVGPITAAGVTYSPAPGTIAPLTGGVEGHVPAAYFNQYDFEDAFYDADRAAHDALHKAKCDDVKVNNPSKYTETVQSGNWSNPATWSNGVPAAGMYACVYHAVIYDVFSDAALEALSIHGGRITFDTSADRRLRLDTFLTMAGSYWGMGSKNAPVPESTTPGRGRIEIRFKPGATAPGATGALGYMAAGECEWYGADKPGWLTCSVDPMAGDTVLHMSGDVSKWRVGDDVIVESQEQNTGTSSSDPSYTGPTGYYMPGSFESGQSGGVPTLTTPYMGYKLDNHNEHRTCIAVDVAANTITLDAPLSYDHPTRIPPANFVDGRLAASRAVKPVVSNLSRSIRFISEGDPTVLQQRAHGMWMHCSRVYCANVQAVDMARTSTDPSLTSTNAAQLLFSDSSYQTPLANPNNVRGRYAFHFHGIGRQNNRVPGVMKNCTAHKSRNAPVMPGWAITHHNSRAFIHDCIVYGVRGGAFVSEVGTEVGQWINCRALWCVGDGFPVNFAARQPLVENHNGHAGIGYELQSRAILMQGCVAKTCHRHTQSMLQGTDGFGLVRAPDTQAIRLINPLIMGGTADVESPYWGVDKYFNNQAQPPDWDDNLALDCDFGFYVAARHRVYRYDNTPLISVRFTCYGVNNPVFIEDYSWHYYFYDIVAFGVSGQNNLIFIGPKGGHMHVSRGIVYGYNHIFGGDDNWYAHAIDLATDATNSLVTPATAGSTDLQMWSSGSITGAANPPTFALDNPSPPDTGKSVHLSDIGGKKLTLDYYDLRRTGDPSQGAIRFDGVLTDGAGAIPWPTLKEIDYIQYAMSSSSPPVDIVRLSGCFNDAGTWKTRLWFVQADRHPPLVNGAPTPHFLFSVDITLTNFPADFLAANTISSPNAGKPIAPFLPEDPDKPRLPAQVPSNVNPPFIIGPLVDSNTEARVNFGTWSEYPAEVDDWKIAWKADGVKFASTRIASLAGLAGKAITCEITALNSAGASAPAPALYSGVCAAQSAKPDAVLGSALIDYWQLDTVPRWVKPTFSGGAGPDQFADNVAVTGDWYVEHWIGVKNKSDLQGAAQATNRPHYEKFGVQGRRTLRFDGRPSDHENGWLTHFNLSGITSPHVWMVVERGQADQSVPGCILYLEDWMRVYFLETGWDASQTKISLDPAGGGGAPTFSNFGKGTRAVIYAGYQGGNRRLSINNGTMQTMAASPGSNANPLMQIGGTQFLSFPYWVANMKLLHVTMANGTVSDQQLADMQTYFARNYPLT